MFVMKQSTEERDESFCSSTKNMILLLTLIMLKVFIIGIYDLVVKYEPSSCLALANSYSRSVVTSDMTIYHAYKLHFNLKKITKRESFGVKHVILTGTYNLKRIMSDGKCEVLFFYLFRES